MTGRLVEATSTINALVPAAYNGANNGAAIDTIGSDAARFTLQCATIGAVAIDLKIQESDDGSTGWADITGAAIASLGDANDNELRRIDIDLGRLRNRKRFIRPVLTAGGATTMSVLCDLYRLHQQPESQTGDVIV